ncbi:unnamed protein product (macronuclear) [Paramecium tetraurelia]|uniref:U4/U6.U5 small nuclear ribonucleoprotein 27kDa protein domain-containing protein n=1 Tax=Paramecium tetraurelia TaxID=5888 RepID=A0BV71_PARTE|nr:uncharacterized protein GSPATT00005684001 [Paramecium tetraurelia]CAK62438.1 unnamed protein product [Paramecium tetraurelia]|eukprot:XP_001429836.1 hypothetical protein (macronuclear) [Paramecium tetraurelia strain d4-2]
MVEEQNKIGNQDVQPEEEGDDEEDYEEKMKKVNQELLKKFGFTSFGSSKGKDHTASAVEGVFKAANQKRKYRQYMHRRGGFNRLLDKMD